MRVVVVLCETCYFHARTEQSYFINLFNTHILGVKDYLLESDGQFLPQAEYF